MSCLSIIAIAAAAVVSATHPGAPAPTQQAQGLAAQVDSFVARRVATDSFSGVVAVARNGEVLYRRAAGLADRDARRPIDLDTKLQIASATKMLTQIAIWTLIQERRVSLTDTVGKFLRSYPNETVRRKVTVEQLLKHRSGIGSFWNAEFMARRGSVRTVQDYLELFQRDQLLFEPGTSEAYSNGGYVILGAIIEQVSRMSYHDYVRDRVLKPAGLTSTVPNDDRKQLANVALGYTTQPMAGGAAGGDTRLAGPSGLRPGYSLPTQRDTTTPRAPGEGAARGGPVMRRSEDTTAPAAGMRLRIMGSDGKELSQDEARAAIAQRAAAGGPRRPNTGMIASLASPAGDYYTTASDLIKLATALTSHRLLDSAHTAGFLGARYAAGNDYRANGGGPGVNAEFSIYPSGDVIVVLSNYDPPAATAVAEFIRALVKAPTAAPTSPSSTLHAEVESLHVAMVAAFKRNPASVAQFYSDSAVIGGMGSRVTGRTAVDQYWKQFGGATDWSLRIMEFGGTRDAPWLLGRSTLVSSSGQPMVTDYVGVLERGGDGRLRYRVDFYGPAAR